MRDLYSRGAGLQACSPPSWPLPPCPVLCGIPWTQPDIRPHFWANSGGPSSRTRTEWIHSSLLGNEGGPIRCPRVRRVGIEFGRRHPLVCVRNWLKAAGFADEEEARAALPLPPSPCICKVDLKPKPERVELLSPTSGLYLSLVLGLCTPFLYDPRRPVVWTQASLTRRLVLYDGGEFYL